MNSNIRELLQTNCERLLEQYHSNADALLTLQTTLIRDILPSVTDEFELVPEATAWAKEWLGDTYSLFRISRRNEFTRSFALEAIRKTLIWRLSNLWPLSPPPRTSVLRCLPVNARDPFGRPVLVVKALPITEIPNLKILIIQAFERLRILLKCLNDDFLSRPTILQYIVLLDLAEFSIGGLNMELITWTIREVLPHFPGMLAGVFMLNYSWTHAGIWNIVKRILPASALSRVFFPSQEELIYYFTPLALPKDYGGSLPFLTHLADPLRMHELPLSVVQGQEPTLLSSSRTHMLNEITSLPPTSLLNPFFGYPVSSTRGSPFLHHGRRRKRDLIRTLVILLWLRWRKRVVFGLLTLLSAWALRHALRRTYRLPNFFLGLRSL